MKSKRVTRRERFLKEMETVVPWKELAALIETKYPSSGRVGRQPIGAERMLRMYCVQQWFALSDEATEDALLDSRAISEFVGLDLTRESAPDATTLLKFRHLLEQHGLTRQMFEHITATLEQRGLLMRHGTLVDATIIAAPPSTKNGEHARDPEMHQTKKGQQWYFGMRAHIGADAESGLVHGVHGTAANESEVVHAHHLLHGQEAHVHADAGLAGLEGREEIARAKEDGRLRKDVQFHIAQRPSSVDKLPEGHCKELTQALERVKASIRARVEHPFHVLKNIFGYRKVRYKGLAKNIAQLHTLFALVNLYMARKLLVQQPTPQGRIAS